MNPDHGSRQQQILQFLLEHKSGLSIEDLALRLEISRSATQQHLAVLERNQLIKAQGQNSTKGRPARNYVLTDSGLNQFPKQYSWFSNVILTALKAELGTPGFEKFIENLGTQLGHSLRLQAQQSNIQTELPTVMQTLGYQAKPHANGLQAYNCVYHDLVTQHPELCSFDRALIASFLGEAIEQTACMQHGDCACIFQLQRTLT